jgi:hypothetical protein
MKTSSSKVGEDKEKKGLKEKALRSFTRNNIQTSPLCKHVASSPKEKEKSLVIMPYIDPHPHLPLGHLNFM